MVVTTKDLLALQQQLEDTQLYDDAEQIENAVSKSFSWVTDEVFINPT